jgi:hypothetical protein
VSQTPDAEQESTGYLRLPLPVVGLGLFVLLAVLLGLGLWANANLRAPGVIVPTPAAAGTPLAALTAPLAADVTRGPTVPAPTPLVATTTPPPEATLAPTPVATVAATPPIAVTADGTTPTPVASVLGRPTPLPTVQPTLAAEVGQSYENFWRVTSEALLELDSSQLPQVMDDNYLAMVTTRIEELRAENRAIKTQVVLNYYVISANSAVAMVVDDIEDNSVYVTAGTEDPLTDPVAGRERTLYTLRHDSGIWKVVDSVRSE